MNPQGKFCLDKVGAKQKVAASFTHHILSPSVNSLFCQFVLTTYFSGGFRIAVSRGLKLINFTPKM